MKMSRVVWAAIAAMTVLPVGASVPRYELYAYTRACDPATRQALCADLACTAPAVGEIGDFIGAQMTATDVVVPSERVSLVDGQVSSRTGTSRALRTLPPAGARFLSPDGACSGTAPVCQVATTQATSVQATFSK